MISSSQPLVGGQIVNSAGSPLGHVDDVIVDLDSGTVSHVLVTLEHVLGLEQRRFAVRPEALSMPVRAHEAIVLDVDAEELVCPETATLLLV